MKEFIKKYVHTSRITIRHNKKTGASRYWFNSSVCIPIFTNVMARYRWTNALFTPAVFGLIDSSESCFILEYKSYFLMWMARLVYIILQLADSLVNFFEVSMTSSPCSLYNNGVKLPILLKRYQYDTIKRITGRSWIINCFNQILV